MACRIAMTYEATATYDGRSSARFLGFNIDTAPQPTWVTKRSRPSPIWPYLETPKDMRSFVGLAVVYRKFVPDFARISARTAGKGHQSSWFSEGGRDNTPGAGTAAENNCSSLVRTDASDFAIEATLRQLQLPEKGQRVL